MTQKECSLDGLYNEKSAYLDFVSTLQCVPTQVVDSIATSSMSVFIPVTADPLFCSLLKFFRTLLACIWLLHSQRIWQVTWYTIYFRVQRKRSCYIKWRVPTPTGTALFPSYSVGFPTYKLSVQLETVTLFSIRRY